MYKTCITMLALLLSSISYGQSVATVSLENFEIGNSWQWAYSEYDKENNKWQKPYLYEKYTVTSVNKKIITIEMSSSPDSNKPMAPHHKFEANLEKCLTKGQHAQKLSLWKIRFYTKSFGPQWELVSNHHKGLAFTEKFNCLSDDHIAVETENIVWDEESEISRFSHPKFKSWYFKNHEELGGVTFTKNFGDYKMELESYNM